MDSSSLLETITPLAVSSLEASIIKKDAFSFEDQQVEDVGFFKTAPVKKPLHLPGVNRDALAEDWDHSNAIRNAYLQEKLGMQPPKTTKTGTTIVGCLFSGGIVLGADTRATEGPIIADKNCEKIHYLAPNIYCCGAGTAADTEYTTNMIAGKLELKRLNEGGRTSRVKTAMTMLKQYLFQYQGHVGAALVLGGCDPVDGPALYTIYPHGSVDNLPFVSMGSGSLAAMAVLESGWRPGMDRDSAVHLISQAIQAGIFNDLGSGSNVDVCVIHAGDQHVEYLRNYLVPVEKGEKAHKYTPKAGTTRVIRSVQKPLPTPLLVKSEERMDID